MPETLTIVVSRLIANTATQTVASTAFLRRRLIEPIAVARMQVDFCSQVDGRQTVRTILPLG